MSSRLFETFFGLTVIVTAVSGYHQDTPLTAHSVGQSFAKCLGNPSIGKCLQQETLRTLDVLLRDNSTWKYGEFIEFEKDPNFTVSDVRSGRLNEGLPSEIFADKLLQLAQARSIRMKMNPKALETKVDTLSFEEEGRKKKDKKNGIAMMGGLAMIAMIGQMALGKVLMIAGAAFMMSKIALLLSILTSLKGKLSGGGSTDHVVTIDSGGGHGHSDGGGHSSWHRSLPYITPNPLGHHFTDDHHDGAEYFPAHDANFQKDDYKFI